MRFVVLLCLFATAAHADPDPNDARKDFAAGKKAYDLGDFKKAIALWQAGYAIKPDPIFLFNLGQAYRQAGDGDDAIGMYHKYLAAQPEAPNRKEVEGRVAELEAKGAKDPAEKPEIVEEPTEPAQPQTPTEDAKPEPKPDVTPTEPAPSSGSPGATLRLAGYVTGGIGLALVITGVAEAASASSDQSALEASTKAGKPWSPALSSKESSGRSAASIADATLVIGGIALATGAVLVGIGFHAKTHAGEAWLVPTGTGLAFGATF